MEILRTRDVEFDVVEYLKAPLDEAGVEGLLSMLDAEPSELIRRDKHFKDLGLNPADYTAAAAVAGLIAKHPRLMQRPIAVKGGRAIIARPETKLEALL